MNFKRILIFILLSIILISSVIVPSYAIDYNNCVAIQPNGYPSPSYYEAPKYIDDSWDVLIRQNDTKLAEIIDIFNGYVFYGGQFLKGYGGNLVRWCDGIYSSAVVTYRPVSLENLITIDGDKVYFDSLLSNMTFGELIAISSYLSCEGLDFRAHGAFSDYVAFNSMILKSQGYDVKCAETISSNYGYVIEPMDCSHDYQCIQITQSSTCVAHGTALYECIFCKQNKYDALPLDSDNHNWRYLVSDSPTCTSTGYYSRVCESCGFSEQGTSDMLDHRYAPASCTEPSCCVSCGVVGAAALGHDFKWNKCQRAGCDAKRVNVGAVISDTWNGFTGAISNGWEETKKGADELWDKTVTAGKDVGTTIIEVLTPGKDGEILGVSLEDTVIGDVASSITNGINIILALVGAAVLFIVIYYISRMVAIFSQARINRPQRTNRRKRK